jgi:hypothetical protein
MRSICQRFVLRCVKYAPNSFFRVTTVFALSTGFGYQDIRLALVAPTLEPWCLVPILPRSAVTKRGLSILDIIVQYWLSMMTNNHGWATKKRMSLPSYQKENTVQIRTFRSFDFLA